MSKNPYCTYKREQALQQALSALESKGLTATWANIGAELGITRQGAQQRFADIHAPSPADSLSDALMSRLVGVDTTLTPGQLDEQLAQATAVVKERSQHDWQLDLNYLNRRQFGFLMIDFTQDEKHKCDEVVF